MIVVVDTDEPLNITLLSSTNGTIDGKFDKIIVKSNDPCAHPEATGDYNSDRFGVLVSVNKDEECQKSTEEEENFNNNMYPIIGAVIAFAVLAAISIMVVFHFRRVKKRKEGIAAMSSKLSNNIEN